jgi:RelB Antitoxin alpha helical domain
MNLTPQNYITDATNTPVAVILDITMFRHIEETLENYALVELMQERNDDDALETLSLEQAKAVYQSLPKAL